jgi:iron complex outermembrane receptor protein
MRQHQSVHTAVRFALAASLAASLGIPAVALAQTQKKPAAKLGKIEVTGTRIKRTDIETSQPIIRISHADLERTGLTNVGVILQQLTATTGGANAANPTGKGSTTIGLRHLGGGRVLVLLNGKRFNHIGLGSNVDLSAIPIGIVDHIEILQDGASSIYGSDAISGVVNIITVKNFNGFQATAYYGGWFGNGHYSGQTQHYSVTAGTSNDRGSFLLGAEFDNQEAIPAGQRPYKAVPIPGTGISRGNDITPQGRFQFLAPPADPTNPNTAPAAFTGLSSAQCPAVRNVGTTGDFYAPFCDLTLKAHASGTSASDFRPFDQKTDKFLENPWFNALTPQRRFSLYAAGHYDITDNITFESDFLYEQRHSAIRYAQKKLFVASAFSADRVPADNPYNPFGFDLNSVQPVAGIPTPDLTAIHRRAIEDGPAIINRAPRDLRFEGGFTGNFGVLGTQWDWDINFVYARYHDSDLSSGAVNRLAEQNALIPSRCQQISKCAPLNLFGGIPSLDNPDHYDYPLSSGYPGSISQKTLDYIFLTSQGTVQQTGRIYSADMTSSDIYDLPGGPLGLAFGYQYREEDGFQQPPGYTAAQKIGSKPTSGRFHVNAVYGELNIPIVSDLPGVKLLSTDVSTRYSDYSTAGGTVNSRVGVKYEPIHDLLLRASYSEGFRAPQIPDLFGGQSFHFSHINDPCSNYPSKSAQIQKACRSAGVPAGYQQSDTYLTRVEGGSNPNLDPETSVSKTVGFVYSPSFLPGASLNADYYKIKLTNKFGGVGTAAVINGCVVRGIQSFCNKFTREASGNVTTFNNLLTNVGGILTEGIDGGLHYKFPSTPFGDFTLRMHATFIRAFTTIQQTPTGARHENDVGLGGRRTLAGGTVPQYKANATVTYDYGNLNASLTAHYISGTNEICQDGQQPSLKSLGLCSIPNGVDPNSQLGRIAPGVPVNHVASVTYYNFNASYTFPSVNTTLTLGMNNIFNRQPPRITEGGGFNFSEYYELLGRFPYARVTVKF